MNDELAKQFLDVSADDKCDLIMKGGIASGVLYPPAILELAKRYRFHDIGGTSAGAIAAAAAAAAEYGRTIGGFQRLEKVANQLAGDQFVFNLFQPSNGTAPLFHTLLDIKEWSANYKKEKPYILALLCDIVPIFRKNSANAFRRGNVWGLCWGLGIALGSTLLMLLIAVYLGVMPRPGDTTSWIGVFVRLLLFGIVCGTITGCVGWYVGGMTGAIGELVTLGKLLTDRNKSLYGICSGSSSQDEARQISAQASGAAPATSLTDWLTVILNELAGLDAKNPLTFEDLKRKDIQLHLVTTNLSQGQPYVFPLKDGTMFHPIFCESDMRKLFPKSIVDYMIANPKTPPLAKSKVRLPPGYHFLPDGNKLPVVVATRMSLSFPILLSAVRLYTLRGSVYKQETAKECDLHEHWFSDGGITSNFPIHMFDSLHPTHPTFGIKLNGWLSPTPDSAVKGRPEEDNRITGMIKKTGIYMSQPNETDDGGSPIWQSIESLQSFFGQILDTMQNFHDNTQSRLPGYRERIVQVYLKDEEGGMKLNMPAHVIQNMLHKGREAGKALTTAFDFEQHQWVRFLVLMTQIEGAVDTLKANLPCTGAPDSTHYERLIEVYRQLIDTQLKHYTDSNGGPKWYRPMDEVHCKKTLDQVKAFWQFVNEWDEATKGANNGFFSHHAPKPRSVLRATPEW